MMAPEPEPDANGFVLACELCCLTFTGSAGPAGSAPGRPQTPSHAAARHNEVVVDARFAAGSVA
jgi:hypothetical protein